MATGARRAWAASAAAQSYGKRENLLQQVRRTCVRRLYADRIQAAPDGFIVSFTKPVERSSAGDPDHYSLGTFTHIYQQGYGSPEVDQTTPKVSHARVSQDGMQVRLQVEGLVQGHVHEFDLEGVRSQDGESLLHANAYYTLNEIPRR